MSDYFEPRSPRTTEREATIQLSDTYSDVIMPAGAPPIADFDSRLTSQVRNAGHWTDMQSPIGAWPHTGNYGAVLISQLRQEQQRLLDVYEASSKLDLPDAEALAQSLGKMVVGVINWAPRTEEHHKKGQNGEDFYIAEVEGNVQLFSQLPFLEGVASRGLVQALWRVRDINSVWPRGEQFRSSIVTQLRNFPEHLEQQSLEVLPVAESDALTLAYADKYGNARIESPVGFEKEAIPGREHILRVDGNDIKIHGVSRLTEIPENELGVYVNPADAHPHYLELVRRVSDPNNASHSAYETLRSAVMPDTSTQHPQWQQVEIELIS